MGNRTSSAELKRSTSLLSLLRKILTLIGNTWKDENIAGEKQRRKSEDCKGSNGDIKSQRDFGKSQSMGELGGRGASRRKKNSITTITKSVNGSIKNAGSSISVSRQKSLIRRDIPHPISPSGRDIICQCFENPHSEFGNKTCQRIFEKRPDFQNYVFALGKERAFNMTVKLKELVEDVVARIDDIDHISSACKVYGEEHVELKTFGFKPDFWVALADAITVEGVILDMANHQPADTVAAWSQLVSLMFSAVRDGYYSALRAHRMSSRRGIRRQQTIESASSADVHATCNGAASNVPLRVPIPSGLHSPAIRSVSMYAVENDRGSAVSTPLMNSHRAMPIFE